MLYVTSLSYNRSTFLGYLGKVDVDAKKVLSQTAYTMFQKVLEASKYITTTTTINTGELHSYPCGKPWGRGPDPGVAFSTDLCTSFEFFYIVFNTGYCAGTTVECLCLIFYLVSQYPTFQIPFYIGF